MLSLDSLCVAGFDGYLRLVNPAFQLRSGYSLEELMQRPFIDLVHPDDRPEVETELHRLASGGAGARHFEFRAIRPDGSERWMAWSASPFPEEGAVYAIGRDVTELKQAEDENRCLARERQNARETETLTALSRLAMADSDLDSILQAVADAALSLVGADGASIAVPVAPTVMESVAVSGAAGPIKGVLLDARIGMLAEMLATVTIP